MAEGSPIGWLHRPGFEPTTLNVVLGCFPVSKGCDLCFAPRDVARQEHLPGRAGITERDALGRRVWTGKVVTLEERLAMPRKWRDPHMIFVTVLGDLFNAKVSEEFIARVWQMMADTPQHIYIILTKQPKRMRDIVRRLVERFGVLPNVHLGVSVEDQEQAEVRIPFLLETPAAVRAVSCEPLLGPVDLDLPRCDDHGRTEIVTDAGGREWCGYCAADGFSGELSYGHWLDPLNGGISWVICGGESGPGARPMHPDWARQLRDQTTAAGVAFFFKQWGEWGPIQRPFDYVTDDDRCQVLSITGTLAGRPWRGWKVQAGHEKSEAVRRYGKKAAGDVLDGRTWHQWPDGHGRIIDGDQHTTGAQAQPIPARGGA